MPFWRRRSKEEEKGVRDSPEPELANLLAEICRRLDDHERRIKTMESKHGIFPVKSVEEVEKKPKPRVEGTTKLEPVQLARAKTTRPFKGE